MENTTAISDLPNKALSFSNQTNELKESPNSTNYTPLNIHPNPYGISDQNPIMPNPELQPPISNKPEINDEIQNMDHQPLPSRDIPNDTNIYVQDPSVKPNYIPPSNKDDFLQDFTEYENELLNEEAKVKKLDNFDYIMNQIQIPILLCVLFYMFNTFFIRNGLTKFVPENYIYSDGNLNKFGIIYLSICFGLSYFLLDNLINYVGNI